MPSKLSERNSWRERINTRFIAADSTREAAIFGSLSHPNIVTLFDIGETENGAPFLVMEYIPGVSLADSPRGKQLSLDQIIGILGQLADALDYAHGRGVIHRDIKPSNLLVGDNSEAKIVDFGVAKSLGSHFTKSQTIVGTPGYMSPEQVLGGILTNRTDIFSLGVVAFELLSGVRPFPAREVHCSPSASALRADRSIATL